MGVGIMGKEGRQAVNNSDYAVAQFRFLTRLLLLHGSLSAYRLSRLIKYSFYKNIAFGGMLFFYQFYCGFSGQARPQALPSASVSKHLRLHGWEASTHAWNAWKHCCYPAR